MGAREELLKLANILKLEAIGDKLKKEAGDKNINGLHSQDKNNEDEITLKQAMAIVDDLIAHDKIKSTERDQMLRKLAAAKKSDIDALCRLLDIGLLPNLYNKQASLSDSSKNAGYDDDIIEFFEKYGWPDSIDGP